MSEPKKNVGDYISIIGLITIYFLLGIYQYPEGISGKYPILVITALGVVAVLYNINRNKNQLFMPGLILTSIMLVTLVATWNIGISDLLDAIVYISLWFFAFNITSIRNYEDDKKRRYVSVSLVYFVVVVFLFVKYLGNDYSNADKFYEITTGYYVICCMPFILCLNNKRIKILLMAIAFAAGIMTFKRSILLTLGVIIVAYLLQIPKEGRFARYIKIIGIVSIIAMALAISNNEFILQVQKIWGVRFSSEGTVLGSRGSVYDNVISIQMNSDLLQWLVGHGYNSVINYTNTRLSAHNDFLEVLFDYGIIAFIAYLYFIIKLILIYIQKRKKEARDQFAFLTSIIIFLVPSFFSHMMTYPTYFLIVAAFWGWATRRDQKRGENINEDRNTNISKCI